MNSLRLRNVGKALTTSYQDVYVAPPTFMADVETIFISSTATGNTHITLEWTVDGVTWYSLLTLYDVTGKSFLRIETPIYLEKGGKIRALAGANGHLVISIRVKEIAANYG